MGYRDDYFKENKSNHGWYTCRKCGRKVRKSDLDVDHIVPQSYGGGDGLDNLQGLCAHCNRSKRDSLRDTPSDYVSHNADRAKKKLFDLFDLD
ncbi:HNH endonuclease [Megamonas funiformis]|jgi:5-methylcytosine-specific restriction endonuclease McrA|uniref:HNH endonuclease n=1 Tax=Megamonas funiformis TaxID=437897 RepID=UPI00224FB66F|nr:HNH endonuclease signature motif containing protein [Megamonas funiformis]MCX4131417.1 HNH endonuclease signature motif containing protein [Megamonas funiformis]